MIEAIILAGGLAKRMRPLTEEIPKALIPVNGRPMMDYQLEWLRKFGIKKIVVACGYKWERIKDVYGDSLIYSVEKELLGTGGAIKLALQHIDSKEFLVVNADDVGNVDLNKFLKVGSNTTAVARFHSNFGIAEIHDGKIVEFKEKPLLPYWANMGWHVLNKDIELKDKCSLEFDVLPELARRGHLKSYKHEGFWKTANTEKDVEELEVFLKNNHL